MNGIINKKLFWCCLFGGSFGIHKFVNGEFLMGIVYLFTNGLWGFGWIFDLIRIATNSYDVPLSELLSGKIEFNKNINTDNSEILLEPNEKIIYTSRGYMYDDTELENVINMSLDDMDFSGPISQGKPFRKKKKKKKKKPKLIGNFYYTNERIIFISNKDKLVEEKIKNINEIKNMGSYVNIFVGKIEYKIYLNNTYKFYQVYLENQNIKEI